MVVSVVADVVAFMVVVAVDARVVVASVVVVVIISGQPAIKNAV